MCLVLETRRGASLGVRRYLGSDVDHVPHTLHWKATMSTMYMLYVCRSRSRDVKANASTRNLFCGVFPLKRVSLSTLPCLEHQGASRKLKELRCLSCTGI